MCKRPVGSPKQVPDPVQPWLQWPMATTLSIWHSEEPVRDDVPRAVRGLVLGTHARSVVTGDEGRTCRAFDARYLDRGCPKRSKAMRLDPRMRDC